jgi:hypothetical protein
VPRLGRCRTGLSFLVLLATTACEREGTSHTDPSPELVRLRLQVEGLRRLVQAADQRRLFAFEQMLVVVHQRMIQGLLASVVPVEGDVGGDFHVRIDEAHASFEDGLALVDLTGEVRQGNENAWAALAVHGGLDGVTIDHPSGTLRASVKVYAVDVAKARVLGIGEQPARQLMQALADGGLEQLLGPVQVPVRISDHLALPAVKARRVRIEARKLPVEAEVSSVRVFDERLWVALRGRLPESGGECHAPPRIEPEALGP